MYKFLNIKIMIILFFGMVNFANNAFAIECFEQSPHLISLEDEYYSIKYNEKLTADENDLLNDLYDNIEGKWKGTMLFTDCSGSERSPIIKHREAIVSIKVSSIEYFVFSMDLFFKKHNINKHMTFELLSDIGIIGFYITDKNNLEFSKLENIRHGTTFRETNFKINRSHNSLMIEVSYYINGAYTGNELWSFVRE